MQHPLTPCLLTPESERITQASTVVKAVGTKTSLKRPSGLVHPLPNRPEPQKAIKKGHGDTRVAVKERQEKEESGQKSIDSFQPSLSASALQRPAPSSAPKNPTMVQPSEPEPCVGDWRCKNCLHWNKLFHEKCRGQDKHGEDCDGLRSYKADVLCVQEHDGRHKRNRLGKYKGDWYCGTCETWNFAYRDRCCACTTTFSDAEYVMHDDTLMDVPPPPPLAERRTEREKQKAWFSVNGRHITPRKKPW